MVGLVAPKVPSGAAMWPESRPLFASLNRNMGMSPRPSSTRSVSTDTKFDAESGPAVYTPGTAASISSAVPTVRASVTSTPRSSPAAKVRS